MNTTRRQFVATSIASLPVMAFASDAELRAGAPPAADDTVLAQIEADVFRAYNELLENPRRVDSLRSFEASLRFHATYATAAGLDQNLKKALSRSVRSRGRAEWITDLTGDQHHAHRRLNEIRKRHPGIKLDSRLAESNPISTEEAERALDLLLKEGVASSLGRLAAVVQKARERAAASQPQGQLRVVAREGLCDFINEIVRGLEIILAIVCGLAMFDPLLLPECAVITMELVVAQMMAFVCELF